MMKRIGMAAAATLLLSTAAFAHPGHDDSGLTAGLLHPLTGADHLLAMLAVGLWSAIALRGKAVFAAPACFVLAMLAGAGLAFVGVSLPFVEGMIAFSVLAMGLLLAFRLELPVAVGAGIVGLFALFHGYAHGSEATGDVGGFIAGFAVTTALLHLAGIGIGTGLLRLNVSKVAAALLGGGIAIAGIAMLAG